MIRPIFRSDLDRLRSADPFLTRILSLYACYGEGYTFVGYWAQEIDGRRTALISRFEDKFSLWLTDDADREELAAFLRFQGAGSVLFRAGALTVPDVKNRISGQVMEYIGEDYISDLELYQPEIKPLYALLQSCSGERFRVPEYMTFLSDVTHRLTLGKCHITAFGDNKIPVSSVMTVSEADRAVILGAVATHPDHRRKGLSRELVRTLATQMRRDVKRVYVLSALPENTRFYQNTGFQIFCDFEEIFM